jgi:hypothetical protein
MHTEKAYGEQTTADNIMKHFTPLQSELMAQQKPKILLQPLSPASCATENESQN